MQRQRAAVTNRYKRAYQEFLDLVAGLHSAKNWYAEMKESVESLEKNVQSFVHNRRTEGAQLLNQIEKEQAAGKSSQAELERERLRELMDRMSMGGGQAGSPKPQAHDGGRRAPPAPLFSPGQAARYSDANFASQYPLPTSPPAHQVSMPPTTYGSMAAGYQAQGGASYGQPAAYNPSQYGMNPGPASPPPTQTSFGMSTYRGPASPPPTQTSFGQAMHGYGGYQGQQQQQQQQAAQKGRPVSVVPPGFVPPPPPPGPPPLGPQQTIHYGAQDYPVEGAQGQQQQQQESDPWAGLSAWK